MMEKAVALTLLNTITSYFLILQYGYTDKANGVYIMTVRLLFTAEISMYVIYYVMVWFFS